MGVLGGRMDPFKAILSLYLDLVFLCVVKIYRLRSPSPISAHLWASSTSSLVLHGRWGLFPEESEAAERELQYPYGDILRTPPWRALPYSTTGIFPGAFSSLPKELNDQPAVQQEGLALAWIHPCTPEWGCR